MHYSFEAQSGQNLNLRLYLQIGKVELLHHRVDWHDQYHRHFYPCQDFSFIIFISLPTDRVDRYLVSVRTRLKLFKYGRKFWQICIVVVTERSRLKLIYHYRIWKIIFLGSGKGAVKCVVNFIQCIGKERWYQFVLKFPRGTII